MPNSVQPLPEMIAAPDSRTRRMTSSKSMVSTTSSRRERYSRNPMPSTEMREVGMNIESPCSPMQKAWIWRLETSMISERTRRRRAESSEVPVPKTWLRGRPSLR